MSYTNLLLLVVLVSLKNWNIPFSSKQSSLVYYLGSLSLTDDVFHDDASDDDGSWRHRRRMTRHRTEKQRLARKRSGLAGAVECRRAWELSSDPGQETHAHLP